MVDAPAMPIEAAFFFNSGRSIVESPPDFLPDAAVACASAVIVDSVTLIHSSFRDGVQADQTARLIFPMHHRQCKGLSSFLEG